jgi:hypothetical protein
MAVGGRMLMCVEIGPACRPLMLRDNQDLRVAAAATLFYLHYRKPLISFI